jgi:hypothetical protein
LLVQEGQQIRPQRASAPSATIAASTSEGARVVFFMSVLSSERRALPSGQRGAAHFQVLSER